MNPLRKVLGIGCLLILFFSFNTLWAGGKQEIEESAGEANIIKIGYTAPFTGSAAEFGTNGLRGIEVAIEEVNKEGIIVNGEKYQIELTRYDSICTPTEAVANVRKLIMEDKVVAILGDHCSSCCMAIAPLCDEFQIPGLTIECVADGVTKPGHDFFFRMIPPAGVMANLAAPMLIRKFNPKTIAFLAINDDYGRSVAASYEENLGAKGIKTVAKEYFERGNTDYTALLTKIKASKAELVYYIGVIPEGVMILKQARELGLIPGIKFIGSAEMAEIEMAELGGADVVEGTFAVAVTGTVPKDFVQKIRSKYNVPVHYAMIMGHDALMVVKNAIELAQSIDPIKIRDALLKTNYDGLQAPGITFKDFEGYRNQSKWEPFLAKWVNGKRVDQ